MQADKSSACFFVMKLYKKIIAFDKYFFTETFTNDIIKILIILYYIPYYINSY